MPMHRPQSTEYSRFILRRGIVPWGIAVGAIAGVLEVVGMRHGRSADPAAGTLSIILVGVLCFIMWCGLVGWAIGSFLWSTRDPGPAGGSSPRAAVGAPRDRPRPHDRR